MTPEEHLKAGDLAATLATLQDKVRKDPADARLRIFLFQLLCVLGDWKRAITQLKVSAELDPSAEMMARTYREAIICEVYRDKVFAGEKDPMVMGAPREWLALLIEAQKLLAARQPEKAAELRARAFEAAPATPGMADGTVGITPLSDDVPEDVRARIAETAAAIEAGTFEVFAGPIKAQDGTVVVPEGEVLDDGGLWGMEFLVEGVTGTAN